MMIVPRKNNDLFDDFFGDPFFRGDRMPIEHPNVMMKTDIIEGEDSFTINVDLPGFDKDNIKVDIDNGYLNINASIEENKNEDDKKYIRKERFVGQCSRSFYIGEDIAEDLIKASFKNGILSLEVPKIKEKEEPEKKYIEIGE